MLKHHKRSHTWHRYKTNTIGRDITNISLGALGIKKYTSSVKKAFAFSWRFIFAFLIVFYLITGITPLDALRKTIYAFSGQTEKIKLYAGDCSVEDVSENYKNGWWNTDKATREADLGPLADTLEFNDENSAFYSGGHGSVVCSSFTLLTLSDLRKATTSLMDAEESANPTTTTGSENEESIVLERILGFNEEMKASSTYNPYYADSAEIVDVGSEEEGVDPGDEVIEVYESEEAENDTSSGVEIVESSEQTNDKIIEIILEEDIVETTEEVPEEEVKPALEKEDTEGSVDEELSWLRKGLRFFDSFVARAEEYITSSISELQELGEFKEATVNFSLALATLGVEEKRVMTDKALEDVQETITASSTISTSSEEILFDEYDAGMASGGEESVGLSDNEPEEVGVIDLDDIEPEVVIETGTEEKSGEEAIATEEDEEEIVSLLDKFIEMVMPGDANADINDIQNSAKLVIWYATEETVASTSASSTEIVALWQKLDVLTSENLSNFENGDYFSYSASFLESWDDVNNLKIKVEGLVDDETVFVAYLDSVWVEVEYDPETDLEKLEKRQRWEDALEFLSEQVDFMVGDDGEMQFRYNKNENRIWDTLGEMMGLKNFWEDVLLEARLVDNSGQALDIPLTMIFSEDGEFTISLPDDIRSLKPGRYTIMFHIEDSSGEYVEIFDIEQEFSWGIMALNFNKSVYKADETAYLQMAVLDIVGHTICDADIFVSVTDPDGDVTELSNADIYQNPACGPESVTNEPDYYAYYNFSEAGNYDFVFKAVTESGTREVNETIKVANGQEIMIERAGPTRIYPKADYGVSLLVSTDVDFKGDITEFVPLGFKITNYELRITNSNESDPYGGDYKYSFDENGDEGKIIWHDVELSAGDVLLITYTFDAPDVSPEFFLAGPLTLTEANILTSKENRRWQIASDAVNSRARTVKFLAGVYNGGASTGYYTNQNYTFSQFNFRLAETGVDIKNAYVVFEAQIESYANNNGNYTGYDLGFDSCVESCAASAFGTGGGQVLITNSNVLAYDEDESNQVRLIYDVTNESQIAAYTGANVLLAGQVGYQIKFPTAVNSIANAKAVLVLTYTYDPASENITNTVVYPLDSTNGSDRGSRTLSQGGCTLDNDCPKFDYTMDIAEWPGIATSTNRLSQWFRLYNANDTNNSGDLDPNINIEYAGQTSNPSSASFHHECSNSGTQGNMPAMLFEPWTSSGYLENASQQLEFYINTGTNYSMGGEVFETYIASSSAPVKTRTVTFPLGVISNGNNTNLNTKSVDVYFPENGTSSGAVTVKSAYFRIIPHNLNSANLNVIVSTKVGGNPTSGNLQYDYNGGGSVIKTAHNIIHIIPSSDYALLEDANTGGAESVTLNITPSDTNYDGISAELVVTYAYTDEASGYLTNINLFGGQSASDPTTGTTTATAESVMPEASGKSILAGGLHASYLSSESDGVVNSGSVFLLDANLSTGNPTCTNAFRTMPDQQNNFAEFYKDITSALNTTDGQAYNSCFSADETLTATDGSIMNGELIYTYAWENSPPDALFITASTTQKIDGTGVIDVAVSISDPDGQEVQALIEFATGTSCVFSPAGDPTLDESDSSITAEYGDPNIDNDSAYQLGTSEAYVVTASGTNAVLFDWLSQSDLGVYEGEYCMRVTANDSFLDDPTPATTTIYIDNKAPSAPGALTLDKRTGNSLTLNFGATSTETNFREYIIYYKVYDGTDPDEGDSVWASTSDINLTDQLFNDQATTTITGLSTRVTYSLAVWAYDDYGNRASSSRIDMTTNDPPIGSFEYSQQKNDGSGVADITIQVDDLNNQNTLIAKLEYATGTACNFTESGDPSLDESFSNILASFGFPIIDNQQEYQIGSSSGYILTSPGANEIEFDWFAGTDLPTADGQYCLRLTANDQDDDQIVATTTIITIDNVDPTSTGNLRAGNITTNSITLKYASTTPATDTNEPATNAYKIFYKQGIAGVTPGLNGETEVDSADLNAYDYNSATSTTVTGLDQNTWYVFNIWSYDAFGNLATATEIVLKTNAPISNDSLTFVNSQTDGPDTNIAVASPGLEYTFRAVIIEVNGWFAISSTTLRIANKTDETSPYTDLAFRWNQSTNVFSEVGTDAGNVATLSGTSASNCSVNTCTLDFNIIFNKDFASSSIDYTAELYSGNDAGVVDHDIYTDFYQIRFPYIEQIHYRWRNDDGGE